MDRLDHFLGLLRIEILPALEEFNETVTLVKVSGKEGLHVFVGPRLDKLPIWLESADEV